MLIIPDTWPDCNLKILLIVCGAKDLLSDVIVKLNWPPLFLLVASSEYCLATVEKSVLLFNKSRAAWAFEFVWVSSLVTTFCERIWYVNSLLKSSIVQPQYWARTLFKTWLLSPNKFCFFNKFISLLISLADTLTPFLLANCLIYALSTTSFKAWRLKLSSCCLPSTELKSICCWDW